MIRLQDGASNLKRGVEDLPKHMKMLEWSDLPQWKREAIAVSIAMKLLGSGLIFIATLKSASGLVSTYPKKKIIGLITFISLTILGYDIAEVGTNLGRIVDPKTEDLKSLAKVCFKIGITAISSPLQSLTTIERKPKNLLKIMLKAHTLVFGIPLSELIIQIAVKRFRSIY